MGEEEMSDTTYKSSDGDKWHFCECGVQSVMREKTVSCEQREVINVC